MHKMFENMASQGDPFGGQMANAQHMWSFLDELSESNPEEYEAFLKGQMQSAKQAKPKATMPRSASACGCAHRAAWRSS